MRSVVFIYALMLWGADALAVNQSAYMYYMQLSVDTYMPVTKKDIQQRAHYFCELDDVAIKFYEVKNKVTEFDDENIRAYIYLHGEEYWIDYYGLIENKKMVWSLPDGELKKLTNNCSPIKK